MPAPGLAGFDVWLDDLLARRPYRLSAETERTLAALGEQWTPQKKTGVQRKLDASAVHNGAVPLRGDVMQVEYSA